MHKNFGSYITKSVTERGLFKGIEVGNEKLLVSHLQYADDTIFLGEWNRTNAYNLQNHLKFFELASSLKVNFHNCYLYGIGVNIIDVQNMVSHLGCQVGTFPFTYIGLPIRNGGGGLNPKPTLFGLKLFEAFMVMKSKGLGFLFSTQLLKKKKVSVRSSATFLDEEWGSGTKLRNKFERLTGYSFSDGNIDEWKCMLSQDGKFTLKKLCLLIEEKTHSGITNAMESMRNNLVPKKLKIFVWRAAQKRLPTKFGLDKRGIDLHIMASSL
ncbi:uncharacterized protein [Rutidosis leptorrhynchoides]|uniref:uncharacterized protein n=1 Tax=Rutidosis leptorrhynchoides TaxID=125765 RepID=UPI003A98E9AA